MKEYRFTAYNHEVLSIINGTQSKITRAIDTNSGIQYARNGDVLWVQEKFLIKPDGDVFYFADDMAANGWNNYGEIISWKSPVQMPRWASRLNLLIIDEQVIWFQDAKNSDTLACEIDRLEANKTRSFIALWDRTNLLVKIVAFERI
jgi:hypothetical protein